MNLIRKKDRAIHTADRYAVFENRIAFNFRSGIRLKSERHSGEKIHEQGKKGVEK
jgi:hypothetical protein